MRKIKEKLGFTIVELLLSLAIIGVLLASVAVAMKASFDGYDDSTKVASVTQSARAVLERLTREVRTASAVSSTSTTLTITPVQGGSAPQQIQYQYANGTLNYNVTANNATTSYVLLGSTEDVTVTSFGVTTVMQGLAARSVIVKITFAMKDKTLAFSATADPRVNQSY